MSLNRLGFLVGTAFGFLVAANGLGDYDAIHDALLFRDAYMWLMFASAVGTAAALLWLLRRVGWQTPLGGPLAITRSPVQRNNVLGALVFGTGWAVAGTCPVPALAMTMGGGILGVLVMAGLVAGMLLRDAVAARPLAWRARKAGADPVLVNG